MIDPAKRTRENTITLFPVNKGEKIDQTLIVSRLGNIFMSPENTILSPIGIKNDQAGLVMASILGIKIMEVARKGPEANKDEVQMSVIEDLKMICDIADMKNLSADDILVLASSDNINRIIRSLEKLIDLLPITPVDANELKEIYECIRDVISAA